MSRYQITLISVQNVLPLAWQGLLFSQKTRTNTLQSLTSCFDTVSKYYRMLVLDIVEAIFPFCGIVSRHFYTPLFCIQKFADVETDCKNKTLR